MKRILIFAIITLLPLYSGCYNLLEINDAVVAQNFSVDILENGQFAFYAQTTKPVPREETGEATPVENIYLTGTGDTAVEAARSMFLYFPRVFLWIHSNTMFIGEKLAAQSLADITDFLIRNRNTRLQAYLFVTHDASVQDVLEVMNKSPFGSCSARCIGQQIEIQEKELGYYTPIRSVQLLEYMVTPGIEPAIPQIAVLKEAGQEIVRLQGMAVVKQTKVIGSLSEYESQGYHYLRSGEKKGGLVVLADPMGRAGSVTMEVSSFRTKIRPVIQEDDMSMKVEIVCNLRYLEEAGTINLYSEKYKNSLENLVGLQIQEQVEACIKKAQALNSDILGWGLTTWRYEPDAWEHLGPIWDEVFPDIRSNIQVKAVIKKDDLNYTAFQFH